MNIEHWAARARVSLDSNLKKGVQVFNRADYSRATTVVCTQEYPITLPLVGIGQISGSMLAVYLYVLLVYELLVDICIYM